MSEKIIDEVMRLVEEYKDTAISGYSGWEESEAIRAKLREVLERNPLTDDEVEELIHLKHFKKGCQQLRLQSTQTNLNWYRLGLRDGERAHNIGAKQ